jgi:hypothetical protein
MDTKSKLENLNRTDIFRDAGVDARIILECNLGKKGVKMWTRFIWLRIGTRGGALVNTVMNLRVP